ncbi:hypothetical protein ACSHWB_22720 [Lentzea sp. HUAS TT2]|uniref:hypothetical protein n=1 Tax=Lentzea sp. HUAS TT2 TaxID=3447454 RepID=UPI003F6F3BB0
MPLSRTQLAADLAVVGLEFLGLLDHEPAFPTPPGRSAASSLTEHGRFDTRAVSIDDPGFAAKVNADWWGMAVEYELFDERRECLFPVDFRDPGDGESRFEWVRVRLRDGVDSLDVAGDACRHFRGWRFEEDGREFWVPEFTMLSVDSRMLIHTTLWGNYTVGTIVVRPDRVRAG